VSIVGPVEERPADGLAVDFVVESDRAQLGEIVQRVRDGRLRTNIGMIATLDDAIAAFNSKERHAGKTIIRVPHGESAVQAAEMENSEPLIPAI
jgi:NADPH:quinone reductase-like Zn-dependent oxidoreductase